MPTTPDMPPEDIIPAFRAASLLATSTTSLRRWAKEGRLKAWGHPDRTGKFYSQADVDRLRRQFKQV